MKSKRFVRLFLLTMVLLFLLSGCQLIGWETVWCLSERVTTRNGETTVFQIRYDEKGKPLEFLRGSEDALFSVGHCVYDNDGNLITYKDPFIGEEITYDSRGNVLSRRSQNRILLFVYNTQNQILCEETQDAEGRRQHIQVYSYDHKGNRIKEYSLWTGGTPVEVLYTYDSRGNMLSQTHLEDGQVSKRLSNKRWKYDKDGNVLLEQRASQEGDFYDVFAYTYDSQGNRLSYSQYGNDGSCRQRVYTYDPAGNVLSKIQRNIGADGTVQEGEKTFYTYDEKGNLIKQQMFDANGNEQLFLWIYDENGNLLTESHKTPDNYYCYTRTYDRNNNMLTESLSGTTRKHEATYIYDDQGRPLTHLRDVWGSSDIEENWEYDANGNLIRHESTSSQTTVYTYTYTAVTLPGKQAQALRESQAEIWKQLHEIYYFAE